MQQHRGMPLWLKRLPQVADPADQKEQVLLVLLALVLVLVLAYLLLAYLLPKVAEADQKEQPLIGGSDPQRRVFPA